jgi:hypothetical protein
MLGEFTIIVPFSAYCLENSALTRLGTHTHSLALHTHASKMARTMHAAAMALLLATCLLVQFQAADCSRQSPADEPRKHAVVLRLAPPSDEPHKHGDETGTGRAAAAAVATADEGRTRADDGAATTPSVGGKDRDDGVVSGGNWSAALLRSKLARRFLAEAGVAEGADSAAGASCHSHDVHNKSCPPASKG